MTKNYTNANASEAFKYLTENLATLPFSFIYGGKKFVGLNNDDFTLKSKKVTACGDKETHTVVFALDDTLLVSLILSHYYSHGVTEWTVWFENISNANSKILEKLQAELTFVGKYPTLKGILGDHVNQYSPYSVDLQDNYVEFSSDTGRTTHVNFPYFNVEYGDGGAMLAIGWAGTWNASFTATNDKVTYTASAVNGLKTYLKPGEKIRSALFVVAPYTVRNEAYATNYWRDWFIKHNMPKADSNGNDITPFSTCFLAYDTGLPNSDGSISENYQTWRPSFEKILSENVKADFRWLDAGWYVRPDGGSAESYNRGYDWWDTVGTWELDPKKWPDKTFLESTEFARQNGMKTLVWFEPERVTDPENLAKNFGYDEKWAIRVDGENAISNNIGDPNCYKWTVDRICKMLRENKVELYREDNNCDAIKLWNHLDKIEGDQRKGITECKFIRAHYDMWDDIIACTLSYGGCGFVDSCASGGGRNDIESLRRGVPLLRSDSDRTSSSLRLSMTTAFNKWIPFCGATTKEKVGEVDLTGDTDEYIWRASYLPALNVDSQYVYDESQNFDILRFGINEWKKVKPYLLKEFYVLTPWHKEKDKTGFTAYCYYDPEKEEGVILAFRQEDCLVDTLTVSLPFIENCEYSITDEDSGKTMTLRGKLTLAFDAPRSAKLLWVKKK